MKRIFEDERPITQIIWPNGETLAVGWEYGIEKIVAYQETGDMACVTWVAIYRNGEIDQRVNVAYLDSISYS